MEVATLSFAHFGLSGVWASWNKLVELAIIVPGFSIENVGITWI
jgi:hypothetical protein